MRRHDPYEVLGVNPGASDAEIRRAWRGRITAAHPDRSANDETKANREAAELNDAYDLIRNARARSRYERATQRSRPRATARDLAEIAEALRKERRRELWRSVAVGSAGIAAAIYSWRSLGSL